MPSSQDWYAQSRCKTLKPEESERLFFVGRGKKTTEAERFCNMCSVRQECLMYAIVNGEEGFWAGTSDKERKAMRDFVNSLEYQSLKREYDIESFIEDAMKPLDPIQTIKDAGELSASIFEISGPSDEELALLDHSPAA